MGTNKEKRDVVSRIFACIHNSGGRFLISNDTTPTANATWSTLSHPETVGKISRKLRDSWNRIRATQQRKTKCKGNVSTKVDGDSDSSIERSNNSNNGNHDKRKRLKQEQWNNKIL